MREISRAGGLTASQCWRIETGQLKGGPTLSQLELLAQGLGVSPVELVTGKTREELFAELAQEHGYIGNLQSFVSILQLATLMAQGGVSIDRATKLIREDPKTLSLFIAIINHGERGVIALDAAARACQIQN